MTWVNMNWEDEICDLSTGITVQINSIMFFQSIVWKTGNLAD